MKLSLGIAIGLGGLDICCHSADRNRHSGSFSFEELASTLSGQLGGMGQTGYWESACLAPASAPR